MWSTLRNTDIFISSEYFLIKINKIRIYVISNSNEKNCTLLVLLSQHHFCKHLFAHI